MVNIRKAPCKRTANGRSDVGFYMSCPFAHPVACMLLCVVGGCFAKFETGQAACKRSQQLSTMLGVVSCWPKLLRPFAPGLKASFH